VSNERVGYPRTLNRDDLVVVQIVSGEALHKVLGGMRLLKTHEVEEVGGLSSQLRERV
jgi:hypothetical protein